MVNKLQHYTAKARELLAEGVHDPIELFEKVYRGHNVHYATVRRAVHIAKTSIFKEGTL